MKKYFLLTLLSVTPWLSSWAQNQIYGHVSDAETGENIYGATVYISELKTGASTDTNGHFLIRNVPSGVFLGEVRMIGYASQAVQLTATDVSKLYDSLFNQVRLIKTPTEHDPVIVTGTSGAVERMRNPVPNITQSRDHMLQHGSTNAVSALAELPGISMVSTGNAISKPIIRGLGYNRVVVLRNGMRQEGQQWGDEHGVEIDEFEIDRVEIIKGPGSIMYGSDAMAGVINFLTPRTLEEGRMAGEFIGGYQSNGSLSGNSLMLGGNINGVSWQVRGTRKTAGNYFTPVDGYVANTGFKEQDVSGFIGLNRSWGVSQFTFSSFNQTLGLPEGERDSLGNFIVPVRINDSTVSEQSFTSGELKNYRHHLGIPRQEIHHHRISWNGNIFLERSQFKIDAGYQQNIRNEYGDVLSPDEVEIGMQLHTINFNTTYYSAERNGGQLAIGVNAQHQVNKNTGSEYIIPEYTSDDAGLFIHYHRLYGEWYFAGGVRSDVRAFRSEALYLDSNGSPSNDPSAEIKFIALSRDFFSITGIAGAAYQPSTPAVFRINLSRGFRAPNVAELTSNGRHEGTFRYESGNRNLKPEVSLQLDLGMTFTSDHFNMDISAFGNSISSFTYLTKVSSVFGGDSIADPADPAPVYTFVQGNARLYGGEIFTDLHPHPLDWIHFENSFSFVFAELLHQSDSTRFLPFTPPMRYQSEINLHAEKKIGPMEHAYISVAVSVFFAQNRIFSAYGTETTTPRYVLLEAGAGTNLVNRKGEVLCRIFFSANNLLNTQYQSHMSRLKYAPENPANGLRGIYGQGRNFTVRMIIPFNLKRN